MSNLGNKDIMARNLRHYIEISGKSQKELSEIVGVAYSTFNDWTNAKKYPRIDKIEMLAHYFGISKSDLIEEPQKENPANDDGISEKKRELMQFVQSVPDDKAAMILRVMKSILENS